MAMRRSQQRRHAAIEIRPQRLHLAVLEQPTADGPWQARYRTLVWRQEAERLDAELVRRELAAGFARLAAEEKLHGQEVTIALSRDYCVTRVIVGAAEYVRRELGQLEERVPLYIGLGHGRKVTAQSLVAIDARRQHALVSVANGQVLQTVLDAATAAKLRLALVEPAQIALVRALAHGGHDAQAPAILVNLSESGLELAISMAGRLLLDYRPARPGEAANVASMIAGQLPRLQKFFDRHYKLQFRRIRQVYLCGELTAVAAALPGFAHYAQLEATVLVPGLVAPDWGAAEANAQSLQIGSDACASLGSCLLALQPEARRTTCNLIEPLVAAHTRALGPTLVRTLWPAAAAAAVALVAAGGALFEGRRAAAVQAQIAALAPLRQHVDELSTQLTATASKTRHLQELAARTAGRAPAELLTTIGQCLPPEVWLERVEVTAAGQVRLSGAGYGEEGVYEFVRWLGQAPGIAQVEVEGISGGKSATGRVSKFEIKLAAQALANPAAAEGSTHASDSKGVPGDGRAPQDHHNRNFSLGSDGDLARSR